MCVNDYPKNYFHIIRVDAQYFAEFLGSDNEFILNKYVVNTEKVGYNNQKQ